MGNSLASAGQIRFPQPLSYLGTMNKEVTAYIAKAPKDQEVLLNTLRSLIFASVPVTSEAIKWGRPVYSTTKNFAYLKSEKAYVTLGFFDTDGLKDPKGLLQGTGKSMRHVKLRTVSDIDEALFERWLTTAAG